MKRFIAIFIRFGLYRCTKCFGKLWRGQCNCSGTWTKILPLLLLLCGCEMAAERPTIVLPPSPAGFGESDTHDPVSPSASVQPARDADMEAIKEILSDLQKQISELKSRTPDTTVEPNSVPIPKTAPVVFQSGYVYVLTSKTCRVCAQVEKEVKGLANPPFVMVSEDQRPEPLMKWLASLPDFSFPVLYWQVKPNDWRSLFGWPGLKEFLSIYNISKQAAVGNQSAGQTLNHPAAAFRSPVYYGRYPSVYDWPGNLRIHLRNPPHNLSQQSIDGMTDQQCIQWHDSWHIQREGGRRRMSFARAA